MLFKIKNIKNAATGKVPVNNSIALHLNKWMRCIARRLQKKTENLSLHQKQGCLFFFCVLFGGISISVFVKAVTDNKRPLSVHVITVPGYVNKTGDDASRAPLITKNEFERLTTFHLFLDSLKTAAGGKYLYDSITKARPHLLDTILFLEKLYGEQSIKK